MTLRLNRGAVVALATGVVPADSEEFVKDQGRQPGQRRSGLRSFLRALPFIGPSTMGVVLFLALPVVWVIVLSFLNYNLASPASWAGVQNFIDIFKYDGAAHSLGVTGYYVLLNIPAQTILAFGLAVMIDRKRRGMGSVPDPLCGPVPVDAGGDGHHLVLGVRPEAGRREPLPGSIRHNRPRLAELRPPWPCRW